MDHQAFAQLLGNYGEFVGAVAVVISLIYVAAQLRTNTRAQRAGAAWDSETIFSELNFRIAQDPEFAQLAAKLYEATPDELNSTERAQVHFAIRATLQNVQAQYFLWREGSLSDENWTYRRRWVQRYLQVPVVRALWDIESTQDLYAHQFVTEIGTEPGSEGLSVGQLR